MFKKSSNKIALIGIITTIITALFFWESAFAEVPQQIFFQAKLRKRDGTTVSGSHSAVFRLYSASSGGSSLWSETQTITADGSGVISCYLGSATAFPSTMDYNSTYYLSIEVDSDGEMSPRIKIVPSLAALNSDRFDGLNSLQFLRSDTADTMEATLTFSGAATDIATASGEHFAIIPVGSGNVGIGTTAPQALLHAGTAPSSGLFVFASGNVGIGTTATTGRLDVRGDEARIWTGAGTVDNALSSGELYVEGDLEVDGTLYGNISAGTGASTFAQLTVTGNTYLATTSGNVGIGTTAPQALLHAGTAPSSGLFVFASGNVGIGTTATTGRLDVRGDEARIWTGAGTVDNALSSGELYVEGDLEVDGTLYGNLSSSTGTLSSLVVTGQSDLRGDVLDTTGNLTLNDSVDITGALTQSGGNSTFDTSVLFVDANSNRVGIGTTSPATALDVAGTITATDWSGGSLTELGSTIEESELNLTDLTTANASTTAHGFLKKLDNTATNFMNGAGNWAAPAGTGANTALSNLASVAINTSLVSDADSTDNLGSSSIYWANTYTDQLYTTGNVGIGTTSSSAGNLTVVGTAAIANNITAGTNPGTILLGRNSTEEGGPVTGWEYIQFDPTLGSAGKFVFSAPLQVASSSATGITFYDKTNANNNASLNWDPTTNEMYFEAGSASTGKIRQSFTNLIRNGSFEAAKPTGWIMEAGAAYATNDDVFVVQNDSANAKFDSKYIKVRDNSATQSEGASVVIPNPDRLRGQYLTASLYARASTGTENAAFGYSYDGGTTIKIKKIATTTTWTSFTWTFPDVVTATGTLTIKFYLFGANGTGTGTTQDVGQTNTNYVWFDGVSLVTGKMAYDYSPTAITDTGDQIIYGSLAIGANYDPYGSTDYFSSPRITFGEPDSYYGTGYGGYGMGTGEIRFFQWGGTGGRFEFNRSLMVREDQSSEYGASLSVSRVSGTMQGTQANSRGDAFIGGRLEINGNLPTQSGPLTTLVVGSAVADSAINNATTADDAYIEGDLEVDGVIYGNLSAGTGTLTQLTVTGPAYLATTSGNVGIGTTDPQYKLEVGGTVGIKSNGTNTAALQVGYTGTTPAGYYATYAP